MEHAVPVQLRQYTEATMTNGALYNTAAVRSLERRAEAELGLAPYTLMQRAAAAALATIRRHHPYARRLVVLCGPGNNGGDGIEVARQARAHAIEVELVLRADPSQYRGAAAQAWSRYHPGAPAPAPVLPALLSTDVVVDGLFGTGLSRPLSRDDADCVAAINAGPAPCVALDVPSGLDPDTGVASAATIRAHLTVAFIGIKTGLKLADGPHCAGRVLVDSLGLTPEFLATEAASITCLPRWPRLALRDRRAHKGRHGRVLIIGGQLGMAGAATMAATAALRAGAGLVRVLAHPDALGAIRTGPAELMLAPARESADVAAALAWPDVVAIGPGLGQSDWSRAVFTAAAAAETLRVFDADALNLAAELGQPLRGAVLTPHPGEAARLLGLSSADIQNDRMTAARQLAQRYQADVILKGAGTLVASPAGRLWLAPGGNPGMAVGGSGDVLTGVVAAMLAQFAARDTALAAAVSVHNAAADQAAGRRERGFLPTDALEAIRCLCN